MSVDVFTLGESMLRLSTPRGEPIESSPHFDVHVAGAESNVASALAQLGRDVVYGSRLPGTPLGRRVVDALTSAGVDCSHILLDPDGRMGVYYVDLQAAPIPTRVFYDRAGSSFCSYSADDIPWDVVEEAKVVHVSGITPPLSESCRSAVRVLAERAADLSGLFSIDVNHRAKLWSVDEARKELVPLIEAADLVITTAEDADQILGVAGEAEHVVAKLSSEFSIPRVVVTDGARGAWWADDGGGGHVPAVDVDIIDRIGAGDAFTAGVIDGVLDDDLGAGVTRGVALAAVALATHGDQIVVTRELLDSLVAGPDRAVDR